LKSNVKVRNKLDQMIKRLIKETEKEINLKANFNQTVSDTC